MKMEVKEYMQPVLVHNKRCYKMFLNFILFYNAYLDFNEGLASRPEITWTQTLKMNNREKFILDCAFPWRPRKGISWSALSDDWCNKIEFEKKKISIKSF